MIKNFFKKLINVRLFPHIIESPQELALTLRERPDMVIMTTEAFQAYVQDVKETVRKTYQEKARQTEARATKYKTQLSDALKIAKRTETRLINKVAAPALRSGLREIGVIDFRLDKSTQSKKTYTLRVRKIKPLQGHASGLIKDIYHSLLTKNERQGIKQDILKCAQKHIKRGLLEAGFEETALQINAVQIKLVEEKSTKERYQYYELFKRFLKPLQQLGVSKIDPWYDSNTKTWVLRITKTTTVLNLTNAEQRTEDLYYPFMDEDQQKVETEKLTQKLRRSFKFEPQKIRFEFCRDSIIKSASEDQKIRWVGRAAHGIDVVKTCLNRLSDIQDFEVEAKHQGLFVTITKLKPQGDMFKRLQERSFEHGACLSLGSAVKSEINGHPTVTSPYISNVDVNTHTVKAYAEHTQNTSVSAEPVGFGDTMPAIPTAASVASLRTETDDVMVGKDGQPLTEAQINDMFDNEPQNQLNLDDYQLNLDDENIISAQMANEDDGTLQTEMVAEVVEEPVITTHTPGLATQPANQSPKVNPEITTAIPLPEPKNDFGGTDSGVAIGPEKASKTKASKKPKSGQPVDLAMKRLSKLIGNLDHIENKGDIIQGLEIAIKSALASKKIDSDLKAKIKKRYIDAFCGKKAPKALPESLIKFLRTLSAQLIVPANATKRQLTKNSIILNSPLSPTINSTTMDWVLCSERAQKQLKNQMTKTFSEVFDRYDQALSRLDQCVKYLSRKGAHQKSIRIARQCYLEVFKLATHQRRESLVHLIDPTTSFGTFGKVTLSIDDYLIKRGIENGLEEKWIEEQAKMYFNNYFQITHGETRKRYTKGIDQQLVDVVNKAIDAKEQEL